jgi:hypothetical protein
MAQGRRRPWRDVRSQGQSASRGLLVLPRAEEPTLPLTWRTALRMTVGLWRQWWRDRRG